MHRSDVRVTMYGRNHQKCTIWNSSAESAESPESAESAEVVSRSAARTPPSTRAGGQDDGSLNKLPQISFLRHQSKAELGRMRKYSPSSVSDEPGVEASRAYCSTSKRRSKSSFSCRRIANPRRSSHWKSSGHALHDFRATWTRTRIVPVMGYRFPVRAAGPPFPCPPFCKARTNSA